MKGLIAVTDHEWFEFLSHQDDLDEVNFGRPRDTETPRIQLGTPYLFKLKKKHGDRIVGFGIFARHSVLPVWMAWEAFGRGNGADSLMAMRQRIERLRRERADAQGSGDYANDEPVLVRPRLGQGTFKIVVMDAYGRSCAVTTEHSLPVLEVPTSGPTLKAGRTRSRTGCSSEPTFIDSSMPAT